MSTIRAIDAAILDREEEDKEYLSTSIKLKLTKLHLQAMTSGISRSLNICRLCGRQLTGYSDILHKGIGDNNCICNDCVDLVNNTGNYV